MKSCPGCAAVVEDEHLHCPACGDLVMVLRSTIPGLSPVPEDDTLVDVPRSPKPITPPQLPVVGDEVEICEYGVWTRARVTGMTTDRVFGDVLDAPISFGYTLASYRVNWRFV